MFSARQTLQIAASTTFTTTVDVRDPGLTCSPARHIIDWNINQNTTTNSTTCPLQRGLVATALLHLNKEMLQAWPRQRQEAQLAADTPQQSVLAGTTAAAATAAAAQPRSHGRFLSSALRLPTLVFLLSAMMMMMMSPSGGVAAAPTAPFTSGIMKFIAKSPDWTLLNIAINNKALSPEIVEFISDGGNGQ